MSAQTTERPARGRARIPEQSLRRDRWWLSPLATVVFLTVLGGYLTVRIFIPQWYWVDEYGYLTPVFSPCISESCLPGASHFGTILPEMPLLVPLPLLVFPVLAGFRATCYYYRKAYYRAFWMSPPGCAVREPHKRYTGEARFPLIIQNSHRYFFYLACVLLLVNTYDAALTFFPRGEFGFGLGSLIWLVNIVLLWTYTLSCHACRHTLGGRLNTFSKHPVRYRIWTQISRLNTKHMQFAWASLVSVAVTDFYIMAVAAGWISDLRFFN